MNSLSLWQIFILAAVQGMAELLPVSSSAHVVVAEKLMGLDPSAPAMTLLLVMLHTGTMFSVIVFFWKRWRKAYFESAAAFKQFAGLAILATIVTGVIGGGLIEVIEKVALRGKGGGQVEQLFSHLELIAPALAVAGVLILWAGWAEKRPGIEKPAGDEIGVKQAGWIGAVQGLSLPFRGFSRSGATISTGMLAGVSKWSAENFSFALAIVVTPPAVAREAWRLIHNDRIHTGAHLASAVLPGVLGAGCAFLAGLLALQWLSSWLERGRWHLFGAYCLLASVAVALLHFGAGY